MFRLAAIATAALAALVVGDGCTTDCPWTGPGYLIVTSSDAECLNLSLSDYRDSSGNMSSCPGPQVLGHNSCDAALTIPVAYSFDAQPLMFLPGDDIEVDVPLAREMTVGFGVQAMLGDESITLSISETAVIDDSQ